MRSKCVVAPKTEGENIRKKLSDDGVLITNLKIISDNEFVYIPVEENAKIDMDITEKDFEEIDRASNYREFLNFPENLEELLPISFDVVGDIYVIKLENELMAHSKEIADAILQAYKNAKVVALDTGVEGEFRTRKLEVLAGENRTNTVHKEYGLSFQLDLSCVYFSPRLATERKRISDAVQKGERIIDMFAGVGPFSLLIAKSAEPEIIYAIDKNTEAITYLIENIKINKIKNIAPMLGDAKELVKSLKKADRVIMNLPHSSLEFLHAGLASIKPGGRIHLYLISDKGEIENVKKKIENISKNACVRTAVENIQEVHTYSPSQCFYCFDLLIE